MTQLQLRPLLLSDPVAALSDAGIQARPDMDRTCHMVAELVSGIYVSHFRHLDKRTLPDRCRKTWAPTNHASNINYHNAAQHKAWSYESGIHEIGSIVSMAPSVYHSWMTRSGLRYDGAPTKAYKMVLPFAGFCGLDYRVFSLARSLTLLSSTVPRPRIEGYAASTTTVWRLSGPLTTHTRTRIFIRRGKPGCSNKAARKFFCTYRRRCNLRLCCKYAPAMAIDETSNNRGCSM